MLTVQHLFRPEGIVSDAKGQVPLQQVPTANADVGPDQHLRPAVRISHSPAMASGILHTIGPHERQIGRRDFSMLRDGGLRRALPPP
jgi:hypothetical protein